MHDFVALDPSISVGVAKQPKRTELETRQGLRSNRVAAWPLQVGGDPTLCGKGAGGFSLHPCHVANAGGAAPTVLARPFGGRAVGENKAVVALILRVLGYKAQSQLCVALLGCSVIGGRMSAVSLKLPHAPCAPLSLDNLQVLVQSPLWPLAEPFHPKLG